MRMSDLTPEEREEVIRMMKEHYPDFELREDAEIDHYLIPFPKDREVMAIDKAQAIWEAQAQQAAREWQAEPGGELADFLSIVNRAFDRIPLEALQALNPEGRCLFRDEFENTLRGLLCLTNPTKTRRPRKPRRRRPIRGGQAARRSAATTNGCCATSAAMTLEASGSKEGEATD